MVALLTIGTAPPLLAQTLYDSAGRVVKTVAPNGDTIHTTYDSSGRVITTVAPNGDTIHTTYDKAGNAQSTAIPATPPVAQGAKSTQGASGSDVTSTQDKPTK